MNNAHSNDGRQILSEIERSLSRNAARLAANKKVAAKRQHAAGDQNTSSNSNRNITSLSSSKQKLEPIAASASDSHSMGSSALSFELRQLEYTNSPRSALMSAAEEWYGRNDQRDEQHNVNPQLYDTRELNPPPPPPPPPPQAPPPQLHLQSNYVRLNENDNRSVVTSASALTSGITVTRTFSQSQKQIAALKQQERARQETADHKKALLSLLQQLKDSETSHSALQHQYESEKAQLLQRISKQEQHIIEVCERLEAAEYKLANNQMNNAPLTKVLKQLSNFTKGCTDYAETSKSASVKKMSDALRIQVSEWAKCHEVDLENTQDDEISSLDMIHELQIEIKMLKRENANLRKRSSSRNVTRVTSIDSSGASVRSVNSHGSKSAIDDSDEVSQLSGVTSMSSCTKMSAIGSFPNDFDGKRPSDKNSLPIPPQSPEPRSKSSRTPPRSGRKVHIQETPQVLSNEEESTALEDFSVASSSPRSIMRKSTYVKNMPNSSRNTSQKRVQLPSPEVKDQGKTDVITQGFADFDQAFPNNVFGDDYTEV